MKTSFLWVAAVAGCSGAPLQTRDAAMGVPGDAGQPLVDLAGAGSPDGGVPPPDGDARGGGPLDPGRIPLHFLNNTEYENTVKDLLGVTVTPTAAFFPDPTLDGFDNNADVLGFMTPARFEALFSSARTLADDAFADPALRARILTCAPRDANDITCASDIIRAFGKRAWRRPLLDAEVDRLLQVVRVAVASGEDFAGAMTQVVSAVLVSLPFLYHVELDPQPRSETPRPLTSYELASRLSYLLWRTMPDDQLFALAASGELTRADVLVGQVDRMLADRRSGAVVRALADTWLGMHHVRELQFDPRVYPAWEPALGGLMAEEAYLYVAEFLLHDRTFAEFLTADLNFVNARLARHYGFPPPAGDDFVRVAQPDDQRKGFLGLAGFLAGTSLPNRSSPIIRGVRILQDVLCSPLPPPPADVPNLPEPSTNPMTLRQRVDQISTQPVCKDCHKLSDPIGLGLESFDALGQFRTSYPNGDPVDLAGLSVGGVPFVGLPGLAELLTKDPRFLACAAKKLFTYSLRRYADPGDAGHVEALRRGWAQEGHTLRSLFKRIVLSDAFRMRRGEVN